ncbi:MAG: hypothetical protein D6773_08990, partial [Alphaproteobacteria bacterium]
MAAVRNKDRTDAPVVKQIHFLFDNGSVRKPGMPRFPALPLVRGPASVFTGPPQQFREEGMSARRIAIPAVFIRGGTSKGVFFHA